MSKNKQLPLRKQRSHPRNDYSAMFAWRRSLPFVKTDRGILIHRPIGISRIDRNYGWANDVANYFCGGVGKSDLTFYAQVPYGTIVCERCEQAAVRAGLPSVGDLHDGHVCVGGIRAFSRCCPESKN